MRRGQRLLLCYEYAHPPRIASSGLAVARFRSAITVGHYDEEEFSKVSPENKGNRTPRWEAEPDYGRPRAPGAAPAGPAFGGNEGRRKLGEGLDGLPIVKPPYGVLSAIVPTLRPS